jgi:hypothetical protein
MPMRGVSGRAHAWVLAVAGAMGCATADGYPRPSSGLVQEALTRVLAAEAEHVRLDGQAHRMRKLARDEYRDADAAIRRRENRRASLLLARAAADADLALAFAREEQWTTEAQEAALRLDDVRGTAPGQGVRP